MNPLTNVKNITKLNEIELAKGTKKSWHDIYKESAWIFIGGLSYGLTEGDIIAVFSQFGEIVNINLVRDKKTGKTKGFCFLCYGNQKSTVLAVDNFNGIKLCNRTIRVDHVANYKPPKEDDKDDEITKSLKSEGCAPKVIQPIKNSADNSKVEKKKKKKSKKEKKEHKKKKKRKHHSDESDVEIDTSVLKKVKIKQEKHDPGYDKYSTSKEVRTSEKVQSMERNYITNIKSEPSSSHVEYRSDRDYHKDKITMKENTSHRSRFVDREKSTVSSLQGSIKDKDRDKSTDKRNRYTSSDDSSNSTSTDSDRCTKVTSKLKSRPKASNYNSSNYASSDDEKHRDQSRLSKNEKFRNHEAKHFSQSKSRDKYDKIRKNYDDESSRNKSHYDRREGYSEHRSKNKH